MIWTTTLPYTRTTINSRFVKRQTNSRGDMQRVIWEKLNAYESRDLVCPGAPRRDPRNSTILERKTSNFG